MAAANSPPCPISVLCSRTGWTGKPDPRQAMLLEVGPMAGRGFWRRVIVSRRRPTRLSCSARGLLFQVILPALRGAVPQNIPHVPRHHVLSAPGEPRPGTQARRGHNTAVAEWPSHTCPTLCLSASDRLSYQFNHITHASTYTLSQIGLIPCCATTPSGAQRSKISPRYHMFHSISSPRQPLGPGLPPTPPVIVAVPRQCSRTPTAARGRRLT